MNKRFTEACVMVVFGAFLFLSVGSFGAAQAAEKYPNKPVRFVITHAPGGPNDKPIRLIQPYLEKTLGVPVVLENMPAAGGIVARAYVQKQAPDGYTLLTSQQPSCSFGAVEKVPKYDPLKFVPIFNISGRSYCAFVVPYDSPIKSVKDLIEVSKKQHTTMSGAGVGGTSFVIFTLLNKAGANLQYVAYNGTPEAAMAVAGKQVDCSGSTYINFLPLVKQKKVRFLALTAPERGEFAPDVPTMDELGYPGIEVDSFTGVYGPPGLPKDKVDILAAAFAKAAANPEFKKIAETSQMILRPMGPEEFKAEFMKAHKDVEMVKPLLQQAMEKENK